VSHDMDIGEWEDRRVVLQTETTVPRRLKRLDDIHSVGTRRYFIPGNRPLGGSRP
jgi:hypothetical protein